MTTKKEKVEFVRSEQFEAVDDELAQALSLLDETNNRIAELLNSEARGDLPFLDSPPVSDPALAAPVASDAQAPDESAKKATPRLRRGKKEPAQGQDN